MPIEATAITLETGGELTLEDGDKALLEGGAVLACYLIIEGPSQERYSLDGN
jgi:hypothetical protein